MSKGKRQCVLNINLSNTEKVCLIQTEAISSLSKSTRGSVSLKLNQHETKGTILNPNLGQWKSLALHQYCHNHAVRYICADLGVRKEHNKLHCPPWAN